MNYLKAIKDEINDVDLERKIKIVQDLICDRLTTDEVAEQTFKENGNPFLAKHAREFQDFNYIVLATLKSISNDVQNAVEEINDCIEKASSDVSLATESDNA
ncbi:hypothetical protein K4S88_07225 [Staphylococcus epidermidis]|nr:hypothetical protein [Staphylococcus epidermidis]MCG1173235.1 hypothetical protein [Staphylococcus epidermidis]